MKQISPLLFVLVTLFSSQFYACGNEVESNCLQNTAMQPVCDNAVAISFLDLQMNSDTIFRLQQIDANQNEANLIICSQSDYERYVTVNKGSLPIIDFNKNILLAGRHIATNVDFTQKQAISRCKSTLHYQVKLAHGVSTAITDVFYFAIVPRSDNYQSVFFDVKY